MSGSRDVIFVGAPYINQQVFSKIDIIRIVREHENPCDSNVMAVHVKGKNGYECQAYVARNYIPIVSDFLDEAHELTFKKNFGRSSLFKISKPVKTIHVSEFLNPL